MRKPLFIAVIVVFSIVVSATYTFINPVGPTLVPIASAIDDPGLFRGESEFKIHLWRTMDEAIAMIVTGSAHVSLLPVTVGAQLASSGVDIKLVAVSMWNGFFFVSRTAEVNSIDDLLCKDVYTLQAPGQTADAILRGLVEKAGYVFGRDVKTVYVAGPEAVQLMAAGRAEVILVPEPFASLAVFRVEGAQKYLPVQIMWEQLTGKEIDIPTSGLFVSSKLSNEVIDDFLALYERSMILSLEDIEGTASLVSEKMGNFPIPVLKEAMEGTDYVFRRASDIKGEVIHYLETLRELDPEIVGTLDYESFFAE